MATVVSAREAIANIPDGATVLVNPVAIEEVFSAVEESFLETGRPSGLTFVWSAGIGPFSDEPRGLNHFGHAGLAKRYIGGHFGLNHKVVKLIAANQVEAYNLPQGTLAQLYRGIAAKRTGLLTTVGLGTFVDPRIEGGKLNNRTRNAEDLVELVRLNGEEMLLYKAFPVHVGIIRGTAADPSGNITADDEAIVMEMLEVAMAVKNCGGFVIAQVEALLDAPAYPHHVRVPGLFVDYVVKASSPSMHPHTLFVERDPSYSGRQRVDLRQEAHPLPLSIEKIICRRAAMELRPGMSINLGVGIPMGVAAVAFEEKLLDSVTMNNEVGAVGGLPEGGKNFGPAKNPSAFLSQPQMFDFYDGGGLDLTCVGLAQADREGNVNVSKIGPKIIGCGGFIDITQSAQTCLFCGEFNAGARSAHVENGRLVIEQDGSIPKFVEAVEQITFSGSVARQRDKRILFITERCVFTLTRSGLELSEAAPGVDIQRDILDRMAFTPSVPATVPLMDARIFREAPMGLAID
ncbi:MAG TPA: CoA-transferase [Candidatus Hydrogenedentes bacterium]|nr:CoA-transferase [Candidatus Hydrogenedentota bacterium]